MPGKKPARGDWNRLLDAALTHQPALTALEWRLYAAVVRSTAGWNSREAQVGIDLMKQTAGIPHGRSFQKAIDGLTKKGLLECTAGTPGRPSKGGNSRGMYRIPIFSARAAAPTSALQPRRTKTTVVAAQEKSPKLVARAIDAFRSTGGSIELARQRGAFASAVSRLEKAQTPEDLIIAAAKELGRERGFGADLARKVEEIRAAGGPCSWRGMSRRNLTAEQLQECGCPTCAEHAVSLLELKVAA